MRSTCVILGILAIAGLAISPAVSQENGLFSGHDAVAMRLTVDFDSLCRPREDENCTLSPATLAYDTTDGEERTLPIEVIVRGGWRAIRENCEVPPLFVVFPSGSADGGLFAGQEVLPLSTHCMSNWSALGSPQKFMRYVIKEYVGYRLFNLVSDKSLRVRLVNMTYVTPAESQDPDDPQEPIESYAFLTEHFDSLAARHDTEVLTDSSYDPGLPEIVDLNLLALFNYMIGNTDWSITRQHNTILIQAQDGTMTPVPYDMDMSGLVNATYAAPAPDAPIRTVRGRWFQGYCRPDTNWEELFAHFQSRRVEMLEIIDEAPGLDRSTRRATTRFIEQFFDILDSPRRRQQSIVDACHPY